MSAGRAPLPDYRPQLALLVKQAPEGDDWIHEIKLDGYRIGCRIERGRATLLSRRQNDWTADFPGLAAAAERLPARAALIDGELAAVLPDGRTSLQAMHGAGDGAGGGRAAIAYFAFDLMHLDGRDLMPLPIEERKARLRELLGGRAAAPFRIVDHVVGGGRQFFDQACRLRIEGIVSKARAAPYGPGARNASWQKTKCVQRQELVIGGYQESSLGGLGSIWLGYHDADGRLAFAGKVGTGFQRQARQLRAAFDEIVRPTPPFDLGLPTGYRLRGVRWLEPRLVCEVAFMEWTGHGHIRHPSFQGLRPDKAARDVVREAPVNA